MDDDWLSRTIHMVDAVMVQYGWIDDESEKEPPPTLPVRTQNKRREGIRILASVLRTQKDIAQ
jgi:hypothetical protein